MNEFKKAVKTQRKLRLAMFGTSGSGKTFSALSIANGIGGDIALIDTENSSAALYADRFNFDTCNLETATIQNLIPLIESAKSYDILIIDSFTHPWQELLEQMEKLSKAKYQGNFWAAWNEGTPLQKRLVKAIINFPGHIIVTMRVATEWQIEDDKNGRKKPVRVGLKPEQGKGIEYEFDILIEINNEHFATIIKDRTSKFQDMIIEKPGKEFGRQLIEWLESKDLPKIEQPKKLTFDEKLANAKGWFVKNTGDDKTYFAVLATLNITHADVVPESMQEKVLDAMRSKKQEIKDAKKEGAK